MANKQTVILLLVGTAALGAVILGWQAYRGRFFFSPAALGQQESALSKTMRGNYKSAVFGPVAEKLPLPPVARVLRAAPVAAGQNHSFSDVQRTLRTVEEINRLSLHSSTSTRPDDQRK